MPRSCWYCKIELWPSNASLDHRKPLSRGGLDELSNYRIVCMACNTMKGALTEREFAIIMKAYLKLPKRTFDFIRRKFKRAWKVQW